MDRQQDMYRWKSMEQKLPTKFRQIILDWDFFHKSPHSHSYYNMPGKTWGSTPLGIMRISNHWNFKSANKYGDVDPHLHCPTDIPIPVGPNGEQYWSLGIWDGEKYIIQETLPPIAKNDRSTFAKLFHMVPNWREVINDQQSIDIAINDSIQLLKAAAAEKSLSA